MLPTPEINSQQSLNNHIVIAPLKINLRVCEGPGAENELRNKKRRVFL